MATTPPRIIGGRWELDKQIGRGSFAVVWRAKQVGGSTEGNTGNDTRVHPTTTTFSESEANIVSAKDAHQKNIQSDKKTTSEWVAVKEISTATLTKKLRDSLQSEIDVLRNCVHENIIGLLDIVQSEEEYPGVVFLVLEFCEGGDVSEMLKRNGKVSEQSAKRLVTQIASGLFEMRKRNLIHRDLKPQNLLLTKKRGVGEEEWRSEEGDESHSQSQKSSDSNYVLKIADFGFARSLHPAGMAATLCGSPLYMAPEILSYQKYDAKADLWSVGCIFFELLVGKPPFTGQNPMHLLRNINRSDARVPSVVAKGLSPECVDLLKKLLRKHPAERMEFHEFFNHPFFGGGVFERGRATQSDYGNPTESLTPPVTIGGLNGGKSFDPSIPHLPFHSNDSDYSDSDRFDDPGGIEIDVGRQERFGERNEPKTSSSPREIKTSSSWKKGLVGLRNSLEKRNAGGGFSLPLAAERAVDVVGDVTKAAERWFGSSPLAKKGGSFQRFIAKRAPRESLRVNTHSDGDVGFDTETDEEYVFVDQGNVGGGNVAVERGVAMDHGVVTELGTITPRGIENTHGANTPLGASVSNVRARVSSLERFARLLRDAAGEKWGKHERLDALAMSLTATAALRTAARVLSLDTRVEGVDDSDDNAASRLDAAYAAALQRTERAFASVFETSGSSFENDVDVPCGMRVVYDVALGWGRDAAAEELLGDSSSAERSYERAFVLLDFLLEEGPVFGLDSDKGGFNGKEGFDGTPDNKWAGRSEERARIEKFAEAFKARREGCLEG